MGMQSAAMPVTQAATQMQRTPQQLAQGLAGYGQTPMSMQRQPQGGMAGRSMPPMQPVTRF